MENKKPCPRFQFKWVKVGLNWEKRICIYSLILPLKKLDVRHTDGNNNPTEQVLEISRTNVTDGNGEPPIYAGIVNTPFRDGVHAQWDNEALGGHISIIAVCENFWNIVKN